MYPTPQKYRKKVLQPVDDYEHFVHSYCLILFLLTHWMQNTTSPIAHVSLKTLHLEAYDIIIATSPYIINITQRYLFQTDNQIFIEFINLYVMTTYLSDMYSGSHSVIFYIFL